jgi:hypothetical protein
METEDRNTHCHLSRDDDKYAQSIDPLYKTALNWVRIFLPN